MAGRAGATGVARKVPISRLSEPPRVGGLRARISTLSFPFLVSAQPDLFAMHMTYWVSDRRLAAVTRITVGMAHTRWCAMHPGPKGGLQFLNLLEQSIEDGCDGRWVRITL